MVNSTTKVGVEFKQLILVCTSELWLTESVREAALRALLQLENYLKSVKLILFIRMMIKIRYLSILNAYDTVISSLDSWIWQIKSDSIQAYCTLLHLSCCNRYPYYNHL